MHAIEQPARENVTAVSDNLLTFTLGNEKYGIDILKVQEMRGCDAVTSIANAPEFIKGVIIHHAANRVVDGASDVLTPKLEQVKPAPEFGASLEPLAIRRAWATWMNAC